MARIPAMADPAVLFVLERASGKLQSRRLERRAELGLDTIRMWRYHTHAGGGPHIATVRRALNALGYDLEIVRLVDDRYSVPELHLPRDARRAHRMSEDAGRFHGKIGMRSWQNGHD